MDYLPSKRFLITALIGGIIVVGGATIARNVSFSPKKISTIEPSGKTNELLTKFAEDRDNDGLRDWEETLWNTDAQNPDTDGDRVNDGDEVTLYRDPAISGPDDTLPDTNQKNSAQPQNYTEEAFNTASAWYFAAQLINNEVTISEEQKKGLSEIVSDDLQKKLDSFANIFGATDIIVSSQKNPKEYINELATAVKKSFDAITIVETDIIKRP